MVGPGGGEGAARPVEDVRWWLCGNGDGGAIEVGVAIGVFWEDETAVMDGCFAVGTSPTYLSPSSPGAKVRVEQKPSEEVIRRVKPSLDQVRSVNVAQWRLLTIHSGVCCWVSYISTESSVATA